MFPLSIEKEKIHTKVRFSQNTFLRSIRTICFQFPFYSTQLQTLFAVSSVSIDVGKLLVVEAR